MKIIHSEFHTVTRYVRINRRLLSRALLTAMCLLQACTGTQQAAYNAQINALASPDVGKYRTYVILPGNKDTHASDLQFKEFAAYVDRALKLKGYEPGSNKSADLAIMLGYGIGSPEERQVTVAVPVFGQTGISSATTTGFVNPYGTYSGTTTYTPSYGITGYNNVSHRVVAYQRYMILDAYEIRKHNAENKGEQIWRTEVLSTGSTGDLRMVFPALVAAATPYLGTSTTRQINAVLYPDDAIIKFVSGVPSRGSE